MNNPQITKPPEDCFHCWKGVPKEEWRYGETVDWQLFCTQEDDIVIADWFGTSVNWDLANNGEAARELINRRKEGEIQFKAGAIRIPRDQIERIIRQYGVEKEMTYELREEETNDYHGHLLFKNELHRDKNKKRTICGALSNVVNGSLRQAE